MIELLIGAACISFSAVFVKMAHVPPTVSAFYRMLFGGLGLLAPLLLTGRAKSLAPARFPALVMAALPCSLFFASDLWSWHVCILYLGPGLATLLGNLQVFFLALVSIVFLRQRPPGRFYLAMATALAGLYLMVGLGWAGRDGDYKWGVFFGLVTAFFYALYILALRRSVTGDKPVDPLAVTMALSFGTAAILCLLALFRGESLAIPDSDSLLALLGYGLLCQALGSFCISRGLMTVRAALAGLILLLQPVLAYVWDVAFFAKPLGMAEILGAALALAGIYLGSSRQQPAKEK